MWDGTRRELLHLMGTVFYAEKKDCCFNMKVTSSSLHKARVFYFLSDGVAEGDPLGSRGLPLRVGLWVRSCPWGRWYIQDEATRRNYKCAFRVGGWQGKLWSCVMWTILPSRQRTLSTWANEQKGQSPKCGEFKSRPPLALANVSLVPTHPLQ